MARLSYSFLQSAETHDQRANAVIRLILAITVMSLYRHDPLASHEQNDILLVTISCFSFYSVFLCMVSNRGRQELSPKVIFWTDLVWMTSLISLWQGANSYYFFFYYYLILSNSFQEGSYSGGLTITICALCYLLIALLDYIFGHPILLDLFILRLTCLLSLGYLIAYRGYQEKNRKRRLSFLSMISRLPNPRFGIDRFTSRIIDQLIEFYSAYSCLLLMKGPGSEDYHIRLGDRSRPDQGIHPEAIPVEVASSMLELPGSLAIAFNGPSKGLWKRRARVFGFSVTDKGMPIAGREKDRSAPEEEGVGVQLAATLNAVSYVSVPVYHYGELLGRIYLISETRGFDDTDAAFLLDMVRLILPMLDNIRLVDQLTTEAAVQERQRLARDFHDSVIQPYIGLRYGLLALYQKAQDRTWAPDDVHHLIGLAEESITEMRSYTQLIRQKASQEDGLDGALYHFTHRFNQATGIQIHLDFTRLSSIQDRLATEVYQLVVEGLNNIRRHTLANHATIEIGCQDHQLVLSVRNSSWDTPRLDPFTPRSFSERVEALGGQVKVMQLENGETTVQAMIPL